MTWLMNPPSQAIKNMKYNNVGLFPFLILSKAIAFPRNIFFYILFYLKTIYHVSRQKVVSVIFENKFFHLCLILIFFSFFIFTRVFFLNLMYSYKILNNFCGNAYKIIIF